MVLSNCAEKKTKKKKKEKLVKGVLNGCLSETLILILITKTKSLSKTATKSGKHQTDKQGERSQADRIPHYVNGVSEKL